MLNRGLSVWVMMASLAVSACAAKAPSEPSAPAVTIEPSRSDPSLAEDHSSEPSQPRARADDASCRFACAPSGAPSEDDLQRARQHMAAGVRTLAAGSGPDYASAYGAFRQAYELSGSLNALMNLAICAQKTESFEEAQVYYERVLVEDDDLDDEMRDQIMRDLKLVRTQVQRRAPPGRLRR